MHALSMRPCDAEAFSLQGARSRDFCPLTYTDAVRITDMYSVYSYQDVHSRDVLCVVIITHKPLFTWQQLNAWPTRPDEVQTKHQNG